MCGRNPDAPAPLRWSPAHAPQVRSKPETARRGCPQARHPIRGFVTTGRMCLSESHRTFSNILVAILHAPKAVHTTSQAAITVTAMAVDSGSKYDESRKPSGHRSRSRS